MKLSEQEKMYVVLEAKHAAEDDDKDRGGFYIHTVRYYSYDQKLVRLFARTFNKHLKPSV